MTILRELDEMKREFRKEFRDINTQLNLLLLIVRDIRRKEAHQMLEFDALKAVVASTEGEVASLNVAVDTIVAKLGEILGQIANTVDPAEVAALTAKATQYLADITANRTELEAAVQTTIPPAPPTP